MFVTLKLWNVRSGLEVLPDEPFHNFGAWLNFLELHKIRRSADFKARKLGRGLSGLYLYNHTWLQKRDIKCISPCVKARRYYFCHLFQKVQTCRLRVQKQMKMMVADYRIFLPYNTKAGYPRLSETLAKNPFLAWSLFSIKHISKKRLILC